MEVLMFLAMHDEEGQASFEMTTKETTHCSK